MGAPSDPSQSGADLTDLWPPLSGLFGPASPQQWAWALAQYAQQQGGGAPAPQGDGALDWPGATPANQVWADAVQNVGRVFPGGAQDGTGQASPADASASPPPTAMAAADAPDQDEAPEQDASLTDAGSDVQAGPDGGAIPASAVAEPSAAQVPISPAPSGGQMPPASSALNPSEQFLRPELSAGPDPLVAALAGDHPNNNPFGFIVDPKTGAVSRPSFGGDPQHPGQVTLTPENPQDKQTYLEWLTGAGAKYPLGQISPEEQSLRRMQVAGLLPGHGPDVTALLRQISQGEGTTDADAQAKGFRSGYDTIYGYGKYGRLPADLTAVTLSDVDALQTRMKTAQRQDFARQGLQGKLPTSAVGKYQFTQETLHGLERDFGLTGSEKFTPALQDTFARRLLEKHGIQDYIQGRISADDLQNKLRAIWSSIAVPGAAPSGRKLSHGTSTEDFRNALPKVQYFGS